VNIPGDVQRLSIHLEPCNDMLEWKPAYETGVPEIDTQHKVLFDNINRLGKLLDKEEVERAEADYLLKFLENYAEQHFKGEESCMARHRCPAHGKNKEEHAQFRTILGFAIGQYEAATTPKIVLTRLHDSMVWWISNHILKVDIQLKGCVGSKAVAN
jgi:hemerythrin